MFLTKLVRFMKKISQIIALFLLTTIVGFSQNFNSAPEGYIAVERYSKRVLLAANTEQVINLGSFSQLATVKVALDWSKASGTTLATPVVIPHGINVAHNPLSLQPGDRVTLRDLIYSISMTNDEASAMVVSDFVGRQLLARRQKAGNSIATFVAEMNTLGASLSMKKTKFTSPYGGSIAGGKEATTTISDLAKLTVGLLKTHGFEFYTKQKSRRLSITRVDGTSQKLTVINHNKLLGQLGISGVKAVGINSVISANKAPFKEKLPSGQFKMTPVQMLVISVNSANRDARVKQLINVGWKQYEAWRASGYQMTPERKEFLQ